MFKRRLYTAISLLFACSLSADCGTDCRSDFGSVIGKSYLTTAYSNCRDDCTKGEDNYVVTEHGQKIKSGMKWQCVEYARRWLMDNRRITFANITFAYQIWDLKDATDMRDNRAISWLKMTNRVSKMAPEVGDLLIYSPNFAHTGHVAVIVSVDRNSVTVAEQNYFNRPWEGRDYSRRLLLDRDASGNYRIFDDSLIGWMRA